MPLRRVCLFSGSGPDLRPGYAEAAELMAGVLVERAIAVVYEGAAAGLTDTVADRADGFLVLPGGLASIGELFRVWSRPGAADKPCGLLNTADCFTSLLQSEADEVLDRFVRETQRGMLIVNRDAGELLRAMADYRAPETRRG